ncbi:MAG TPA: cytochrome c oxidase accessory protein CcoG [Candidatus Competibacteraceae bacterium]|nr:cytochrome c oxidase accessory protein CcoG [Candidatus Competibacteraceae bacterium]
MSETSLYQKRIPIYPRSVKGRFRTIKYGILILAYSVYFLLPWLRWERPGAVPDQAVLFDLPGRHFYLFSLVVQAQDIFWLAGFLVIAAMLLFFVTGIAGRVFCGYFCFQTLWTDVFILIERWVQGERPARLRLASAPWDAEKLAKLGTTWALWLLVAMLTGLTFTLYWADAPTLLGQLVRGTAPFPAYATTLFLTATTFVMAGLAREQVCTYMCPYARFQSVMFDRDTLIVAYDRARGEGTAGRAKLSRELKTREQRQAVGVGDCIDCGYCVQVCPTGIDIRNGLQLQCIHCALCIDACDSIMDSLNWPRGLIGYSSERAQQGEKTRYLKPKTLGYGVVLLGAIAALTWSVVSRAPFNAAVEQIRQPLYVTLSDGEIQNSYEIKLNNKIVEPIELRIGLQGLSGATLDLGPVETVRLGPEQRLRVLARVKQVPRQGQAGQQHFAFVITPVGGLDATPVQRPALFYTPE